MAPTINTVEFNRGEQVEVCSKEEGFLGSYYEAKIISCMGYDLYVVEYENLLEDDQSKSLRETVYGSETRPIPPTIPASQFCLHQKVDAFDNDGWWVGIITEKEDENYKVYFEIYNEEIAYPFGLSVSSVFIKNGSLASGLAFVRSLFFGCMLLSAFSFCCNQIN